MYTKEMNSLKKLIRISLITVLTMQLGVMHTTAQHHPTYDRKPASTTSSFVGNDPVIQLFEVYPAKTDGELNIVMDDFLGQSVEIMIHDKYGKTVLHQRIDEVRVGYQWLDLNDYKLSNGKYTITVLNNGQSYNAETVFSRKK